MRHLIALLLLLLLALSGCGNRAKSEPPAPAPEPAADRGPVQAIPEWPEHADEPRPPVHLARLTNQAIVFECRRCERLYDGSGECVSDGTELGPARITYRCPADEEPVPDAGKCPRCGREAEIFKAVRRADGIRVMAVR